MQSIIRHWRLVALLSLTVCAAGACQEVSVSTGWETLAEGLELGAFDVNLAESNRKARITVMRIDPSYWNLELRSRSETDGPNDKSARQWAESEIGQSDIRTKLIVATNAGMFNVDYLSHIGYMKSGDHVNNPQILRNQYLSAALFGSKVAGAPEFQIVDLDEVELDSLKDKYHYVIQNLRLIKYPGENRWQEQTRKWSEVALAQDSAGNALLIFTRHQFSMYEFNEIILSLPLQIIRAQHLEGGPEAQLFYQIGESREEFVGSFESNVSGLTNQSAWPIPNAIVVKPRTKAK